MSHAAEAAGMFEERKLRERTLSKSTADFDDAALGADDERKELFGQIVDLLLAGGYFRARISGLSPFDKVIGGMAWSITAAAGDLDIDIFFQEEAQIGQKIKVGEQILVALKRLGCQLPLQSHQIQGLDFKNIHPVIVWLVKRVIEIREETGDLMRQYSVSQFANNGYEMPDDTLQRQAKPVAVQSVQQVQRAYTPQRRYRRHFEVGLAEEEEVALTLLEYGAHFYRPSRPPPTPTTRAADSKAKQLEGLMGGKQADSSAAAAAAAAADEKKNADRMKRMQDSSGHLSGRAVQSFLPAQDIAEIAERYARDDAAAGTGASGLGGKLLTEKLHKTKMENLQKNVAKLTRELETVQSEQAEVEAQLQSLQLEYEKQLKYNNRVISETAKLEALETEDNKKVLNMLRQLVAVNESLKAQEQQFKACCKRQMSELKAKIQELERDEMTDQERERLRVLNEREEKEIKKVAFLRQQLAQRSRECQALERKIDDVPGRSELQQYQRQFVELYEQVASKLVETRCYYNTFNSLQDTKMLYTRELSFYNTILERYKTEMSSKATAATFVKSLETVVNDLAQSAKVASDKLAAENAKKDELNGRYLKLIEKQRAHHQAAKEFQEACAINEKLQQQVSSA